MTSKKWSLAAAARFAREARIVTAGHMETAAAARAWHRPKMVRAYEVHSANLRSREVATLMLYGGLGFQPPFPTGWDEAADVLLREEARCLAGADLYVLTPQMCDVVVAAAQGLSVEDLQLIDEDDLSSSTGLVVLPYPLVVRAVGGDLADDRAFAWHTPAAFRIPRPGRDGWMALPAVRTSRYHDTHGPVRPDSFLEFAAQARRDGTPLPPLLLDGVRLLYFAAVRPTKEAISNA